MHNDDNGGCFFVLMALGAILGIAVNGFILYMLWLVVQKYVEGS